MVELIFDSDSVIGRFLSGRTASSKAESYQPSWYKNKNRQSRAYRRAHTSHASQGSRRARNGYDCETPQVSYRSVYCEDDGYGSVPLGSNSAYQDHGTYPDHSCQQCFDAGTYYADYSGHTPHMSYHQTVPLTIPPPIYDHGIPPPGPVPYSQSYGYSPHTPNYPQSSGYSSQTPNYYISGEGASRGYRGTGVSEQQSRGRKCIFCGNPGLNLTVEKDGKILHPYIVQRDRDGHTWLAGDGDSLAETHGVACMADMGRLRELWVEACGAEHQFVEFYPHQYSENRWYIFASRKAYGEYNFFDVDFDVESVA